MQVRSQEIISDLENRIRGAKYTIISKQITQNPDSQEYPWQFESHIEFPLTAPALRRFQAVETPKKPNPVEPSSTSAEPEKTQVPDKTTAEQPPATPPPTEPPPTTPPQSDPPNASPAQSPVESPAESTAVPTEVKS
jgi:hypothetical protein